LGEFSFLSSMYILVIIQNIHPLSDV
jgi:hypothetical protein